MNELTIMLPSSKDELLSLLAELGSKCSIMAGGTDLVPSYHKGKAARPSHLISIGNIAELSGITLQGDNIVVGAATTHEEIVNSSLINSGAEVLHDACSEVAAVQIRNVGTIGGNIANASPAADSAPALLVLDASVKIVNSQKERQLKLSDFFIGPGKTALNVGEIIESIQFESLGNHEGSAFVKLGRRKAFTLSVVSAAAYVKLNADLSSIAEARVALGAVAPVPLRIKITEEMLKGFSADKGEWAQVHQSVLAEIKPISDIRGSAEYRQDVSGDLVERALRLAIERAKKRV